MRWILGTGLLLLSVSFLASRARWTRYFAATSAPGTATWFPRLCPYLFCVVNTICAVAVYWGYLGSK